MNDPPCREGLLGLPRRASRKPTKLGLRRVSMAVMLAPMAQSQSQPELPGMIESADDGDRPSITEVNGTVAHFEMAYNPNPDDRFVFGPPIWQRLPSLLFLGFGAAVGVAAVLAHTGSSNTALYRFIVTENRTPLVFVIVLAAIATFIRSGLRGVVVTRDGVETRSLSMGFPRREEVQLAADRPRHTRQGRRPLRALERDVRAAAEGA